MRNRTTYILVAAIAAMALIWGFDHFSRPIPNPSASPPALVSSHPSETGTRTIANSTPVASVPTVAPTSEPVVAPAEEVKAWVNTKTGIWHRPGTRWYGTTKQGEYMTVEQARAAGYRASMKE